MTRFLCLMILMPLSGAVAWVAWGAPPTDAADPVIAAAYYFPNWHRRTGETGQCFGEWPVVARATPRFDGHAQPKRPAWGVEDEADPNVMAKKIAAAADHGLGAFIFCWYYHAEGPYLSEALDDGYLHAPNLARVPFALMWANHDVGSRKGAVTREVFDHMGDLLVERYFKNGAYWRVGEGGRCYFSIYQPITFIQGMGGAAPARAAIEALRDKARHAGVGEIHLNLIDWQPSQERDAFQCVRDLGADSLTSYVWVHTVAPHGFPTHAYEAMRDDYFALWDRRWSSGAVPHFPNVTMGWDPTPRLAPDQPHTGKQYPDTPVLVGNTPAAFRAALQSARDRAAALPRGRRVVTIYAWNEWTEGGYLEPEAATGMQYLDAVREVFGAR